MNLRENIPLAPLTTFKIGGNARFFVDVTNEEELLEALAYARAQKIPFFILGSGSNILVGDDGFPGIVIRIAMKSVRFENAHAADSGKIRVMADAGAIWDDVVKLSVEQNLHGIENLSGIPGTTGAAPVQNIGAYGSELKDTLEWVSVCDAKTGELKKLSAAECHFGYRSSIFKTPRGRALVIVQVSLLLSKSAPLNTAYKDVTEYFASKKIQNPTLPDIRNAILEIRGRKLPDPATIGSAGSFFKNPTVSREHYSTLQKSYPEMPSFEAGQNQVKVPLGWILEHVCNWKGKTRGNIGVYKNQALVLVNFGGGTASDIKSLAAEMAATVKEKTNIDIFPEVEYVGS